MKKTIFTLLVAFGLIASGNAQNLVNFDDVSGTLGGWCSAAAIVANPDQTGLNTSAQTSMFTTIPANWWAAQVNFEAATVGEYNAVEFLVYVDDAGDGIELKELKFGAFNGIIDPALAKITESGTWVKMTYQLEGAVSTDVIDNFFAKIYSPATGEINVYFDEFALTTYSFEPEQQPARLTTTALKTSSEMAVDGEELEPEYAQVAWQDIAQLNMGDGVGLSGKYKLLWDADYLYMLVNVTDPDLFLWDETNWASWKGDGLQLYLDAKNRRYTGITNGAAGTAANPDRESDAAFNANKGFSQESDFYVFGDYKVDFKQGSVLTTDGYQLELAWSWKGIANSVMDASMVEDWVIANIMDDYKFSFDIQVNDVRGGERTNIKSWCAIQGPYGSSGTWGEVSLISPTIEPVLVSSIELYTPDMVTTIATDGGSLQVSATVLPENADDKSVTWSVANGTGEATISESGLLTAVTDGTVTVNATANDGSNVSGSLEITISNQTGISSEAANTVKVYPNPAKDYIIVTMQNIHSVVIYNMLGTEVFNLEAKGNEAIINVSQLNKGVYFVKAANAAGQHSVSKITVN